MTAPDRTTWTVAEDPYGCPTIWDEQHVPVATMDVDIVLNEQHRALVWLVLTRVLAPDEATIERLAQTMHDSDGPRMPWSDLPDSVRLTWRRTMRMALAALVGTAAPERDPEVGA